MAETIIPIQSEYEKLLEAVKKLRTRVIELTAERDDLLYHICPALQAKYDENIASVERELLAAQMYLKEKQRVIEILQAQLNRREKPSMKEAEKKAHEEFRAYEEELKKKAEEARSFRERWEKESQWSKHEQERSTREKREKKTQPSSAQNKDSEEEIHKRIGLADDPYNEDFDAKADGEEGEDPIHELKRLYRQIVKRLHPDVHPNPTEREKDLLNRANKAYKAGDLEEMHRIWEELAGMEQPEEIFEDTEEGRERLRELIRALMKRCEALEEEIGHIKSSFPYTVKILLDDDKALEMKRRELLDQLAEVRALLEKMDECIAELKRRMSKKKE